jgi:hypothetical protein
MTTATATVQMGLLLQLIFNVLFGLMEYFLDYGGVAKEFLLG